MGSGYVRSTANGRGLRDRRPFHGRRRFHGRLFCPAC